MFKLAEKNKIKIAYKSEVEVCAAYKFSNLQEFLDIYYAGCEVLIEE
jgi:adenosine deaminase